MSERPSADLSGARRRLRIATRGSALALAQARLTAQALAAAGWQSELVLIETEGDRRRPDTAWGEGAFVKAIEQALLDARADVAVHSAKDVPTDEDPRLAIVAYLPREEPLDALVVAGGDGRPTGLDSLPSGSVVGTDSPRRAGFVRWQRPDVEVRPLHGNVDTRLRRLDAGEADALVLAVAGLVRLGRAERISERLRGAAVPPAPGQGAICLQVRADDVELRQLLGSVDDPSTRLAVETERAFLRASGGGCRAPIGALAEVRDGRLRLLGGYTTAEGAFALTGEVEGSADEGAALAEELARRLARQRDELLDGPRVLLTRPAEASRRLAASLAHYGLRGIVVPTIEIRPIEMDDAWQATVSRLAAYERVIVTSANGARALTSAAARLGVDPASVRWAAVGGVTARALRATGARDVWLPAQANAMALAAELPLGGGPLLFGRGDLAEEALARLLRERGAAVEELVCYRTLEAPAASAELLRAALADARPAAVLLASPSAVRGMLALADEPAAVLSIPAICIGPTTAALAEEAGFAVLGQATTQDAMQLARLAAELLQPHAQGTPA